DPFFSAFSSCSAMNLFLWLDCLLPSNRYEVSNTVVHFTHTRRFEPCFSAPLAASAWTRARRGAAHLPHQSETLDDSTEPSFSTMPPRGLRWLGLVWRLTMLTRSITTRPAVVIRRSTRPRFPFSLPAITTT